MVDPGIEPVDIVDDEDRVVATVPRREMRARRLLHRCTYVLVRNSAGLTHVHRRTDTKDTFPGAYDMLPGGVCASGESYDDCARRELAEELGIEVLEAEPLLELVHDYPEKRVLLDVWRVLRYRGEAEGREGQLLRWVAVDELAGLPLLEADGPIVEALRALPARG